MASISPISGIRPPAMSAVVGEAAPQKPAEGGKASFADMLRGYVGDVDNRQQASYEAIKDLIAGRSQDVLPVVNAVAQADLSFKLLMGVRNKVIDAYKQTMSMQV
jgi:flagellar hook-basal body complex protein FliE